MSSFDPDFRVNSLKYETYIEEFERKMCVSVDFMNTPKFWGNLILQF